MQMQKPPFAYDVICCPSSGQTCTWDAFDGQYVCDAPSCGRKHAVEIREGIQACIDKASDEKKRVAQHVWKLIYVGMSKS